MKQAVILLIAMITCIHCTAQTTDELQIKNVLTTQQAAWNRGDIESFMQGYWHNDSLMFIGKSGITYGWQQTLSNYKKGYPDTASMGQLNFSFTEIKKLSAQYYFVVGTWHLTRSIGDAGGHFTLLFQKIKGQWLIIKDHSS